MREGQGRVNQLADEAIQEEEEKVEHKEGDDGSETMDDSTIDDLLYLQSAQQNKLNYRHKFRQLSAMPGIQFQREFRMTKDTFRTLNDIYPPLISGANVDPDADHQREFSHSKMPKMPTRNCWWL